MCQASRSCEVLWFSVYGYGGISIICFTNIVPFSTLGAGDQIQKIPGCTEASELNLVKISGPKVIKKNSC